MARLLRVVVPGLPHHVTQRGNRREPIFFEDGDHDVYCDLLAEQMRKAKVEVWAYCLMPNHVHLVLTPVSAEGLARAMREAYRRYAGFINARARWNGHLFQGRYGSVAMAAVRYVSLKPVRARLVAQAQDWAWSNARAHLKGEDDGLVVVRPVLDRVERFADIIAGDVETESRHTPPSVHSDCRKARDVPPARAISIDDLERLLGRKLARRAPGRKSRAVAEDQGVLLSQDGCDGV